MAMNGSLVDMWANRHRPTRRDCIDATHIVLDQRLIKSPEELAHMRRAGEMTWASIEAAMAATPLMSIDPMLMTGRRMGLVPHIPTSGTRSARAMSCTSR